MPKPATTKETKEIDRSVKGIALPILIHLCSQGKSTAEIGAIVGCSAQNVQARLAKEGINTLHAFKTNRADIYALKGQKILNTIDDKTIKRAGLGERTSGVLKLATLERLERDLSTENISIHADIRAMKELEASPVDNYVNSDKWL